MSARSIDFNQVSRPQLQAICKAANIPASGPNYELRKRLQPSKWSLGDDDDEDHNIPSHNKRQKKSPAADLICPITHELPWDPVTAEDGRIYERSAIEEHFKNHAGHTLKSPITNEKMGKKLLPAPQHKNLIFTFVENGEVDKELASNWNKKVEQQKAKDALINKARNGDGRAMHEVGLNYYLGDDGFQEDYKLAFEWFQKSHLARNMHGTACLGEFLLYGYGGETCHKRGMMYTSIAAGQGSDVGAFNLGMALADGSFNMVVDPTEAIYWLEKAIDEDCSHPHLTDASKDEARQKLEELRSAAASAQAPK